MSSDLKERFHELFDLPEDERASLARLLLESVGPWDDRTVEQEWVEEAERRTNEIDEGKVETVPWTELRERFFRTG